MEDIYLFIAVTMLMAHVTKHRIQDYWSVDEYISTPIFLQIMTRDRYLQLWTYLHFHNNQLSNNSDRLFKIRPVINHLKEKFRDIFMPFQNLCINELLMLYKGRLKFKQY